MLKELRALGLKQQEIVSLLGATFNEKEIRHFLNCDTAHARKILADCGFCDPEEDEAIQLTLEELQMLFLILSITGNCNYKLSSLGKIIWREGRNHRIWLDEETPASMAVNMRFEFGMKPYIVPIMIPYLEEVMKSEGFGMNRLLRPILELVMDYGVSRKDYKKIEDFLISGKRRKLHKYGGIELAGYKLAWMLDTIRIKLFTYGRDKDVYDPLLKGGKYKDILLPKLSSKKHSLTMELVLQL